MKTIVLSLLVLTVCAGCVTRYNVTLSNGDIITSKGKPHLNADQNMWTFKDVSGQTNYIPAANVSQVAPQSMADDDKPKNKYLPVNPVLGK